MRPSQDKSTLSLTKFQTLARGQTQLLACWITSSTTVGWERQPSLCMLWPEQEQHNDAVPDVERDDRAAPFCHHLFLICWLHKVFPRWLLWSRSFGGQRSAVWSRWCVPQPLSTRLALRVVNPLCRSEIGPASLNHSSSG